MDTDTSAEQIAGRPTTALLYNEMGALRSELSARLEKFEERITARLEAMGHSQSDLALKNAHDIGVLETRVEAHQAAIEKFGDSIAIAHDARNRVGAIERARSEEAQAAREGSGKVWQVVAAVIGGLTLIGGEWWIATHAVVTAAH